MRSILHCLCGLGAVAACTAIVTPAAAQNCVWGCYCHDNWCSCNTRGSGGSCEADGTGCTVYGCVPVKVMRLAPDGSPVRLASLEPDAAGSPVDGPLNVRWEYVARGRAAARDCTGVVVARYLDHGTASSVRRRQHMIWI